MLYGIHFKTWKFSAFDNSLCFALFVCILWLIVVWGLGIFGLVPCRACAMQRIPLWNILTIEYKVFHIF